MKLRACQQRNVASSTLHSNVFRSPDSQSFGMTCNGLGRIRFQMKTQAIFCFVLLSLVALDQKTAADWPQYRGPSASGVDANHALPTSWDVETGENVRWHTPIPGLAHSSPIVAAERVYVAT